MPPNGKLVSISRLTKRFGSITAVWNVDLAIERGNFWGVFGPNGAGKTTLLRMIARLTQPSDGQIDFAQQGGRSKVGYVSHQSLLYNDLSGLENLVFFARLYEIEDPAARAQILLDRMELGHAQDRLARGYSSGMKQRLTLARALLHDPELLLLDEPYAGLDQHGSRLLTSLLQQLRRDGRTVLLITHNLAEGLALSSHIAVMNRGRIVYQGPSDEIEADRFEHFYFRLVED